ncbi:unnamed protein product [Prunus armeniaca]
MLETIAAFGIVEEGEPSYEQFAHLYSVTKVKSADQRGWVQSNCLSAGQRGHFVVGVPSSQKIWRLRRVLISGAWEFASGVIMVRHIPTTFQTVGRLSLNRPIAKKEGSGSNQRVRTLLDFGNMFKAGLISEAKHARRQKEKEEEERRKMAGGGPMNEGTRRRLESQAPLKKKDGSQRPRTKPPC